MNIVVARQPIYDKKLNVIAYELLYRRNTKLNEYSEPDDNLATVSVIIGTLLNGGLENITDNKFGFINFTDSLLKNDAIRLLSSKHLVIEILETVDPTDEVLNACDELIKLGYTIALDDYVYTDSTKKFIKYAKIIKMDFQNTTDDMLKTIVKKYKKSGIKFLAEKIETKKDFIKAKLFGYSYFQGYYFCRPELVENKVLLPLQMAALQVYEMLRDDNCDINKLTEIISYDPGMLYKLFRLANSVEYGGRYITKHANLAVMRIGLKELRTWILFILMHGMNTEKPDELIKQSIIRARAAEEICVRTKLSSDISGFSMLGLFSLLDALLDIPFNVILSSINIHEKIKAALMDSDANDDIYSIVIRFIRAYDNANWEEAVKAGKHINLSIEEYGNIYLNTIKWCDSMYKNIFQHDEAAMTYGITNLNFMDCPVIIHDSDNNCMMEAIIINHNTKETTIEISEDLGKSVHGARLNVLILNPYGAFEYSGTLRKLRNRPDEIELFNEKKREARAAVRHKLNTPAIIKSVITESGHKLETPNQEIIVENISATGALIKLPSGHIELNSTLEILVNIHGKDIVFYGSVVREQINDDNTVGHGCKFVFQK